MHSPSDGSGAEAMLPMPLTCFRRGARASISCVALSGDEGQRLRDLGLREGACVCVMLNADKCILGLDQSRIALRREVAMQLLATPTS